MNNYERHLLAELFDDADDNGDNFLTTEEFQGLLNNMGFENILENLGWIDKYGPSAEDQQAKNTIMQQKNALLNQIMNEMRTTYRNAVVLDQFIALMSRFMDA